MANCGKLVFGLKREVSDAAALWGARAIYSHGQVDLLDDRQDLVSDNDESKSKLIGKLNSGALKKFCKWAESRFSQDEVIDTVCFDGVKFYATTNRSYGYLYITAHEET
jgi:hypothetical protein